MWRNVLCRIKLRLFLAGTEPYAEPNLKSNYLPTVSIMVHYNFAYPNHVVFDLYGVNFDRANDLSSIIELGRRLARKLKSDIIGEVFHTLEPQGIIYVATLLQSHIAVHTWPELGYVSVDIYTCSEVSVKDVEEDVIAFFSPERYKIQYLVREVAKRPSRDIIYKE